MGGSCCRKSPQPGDAGSAHLEPEYDTVKPSSTPALAYTEEHTKPSQIAPAPAPVAVAPSTATVITVTEPTGPSAKTDDARPVGSAQSSTTAGDATNLSASFTPSEANLSHDASESLKQYAKRNKPKKDMNKFMTHSGAALGVSASPAPLVGAVGSCPIVQEAKSDANQNAASGEETQIASENGEVRINLDEKMQRFDIFDDVDEERMKEFDDIFQKVKDSSNYEAHKKRSKKLDPNKFSTCAGVATDQDTGLSMLT